MNFISISNVYNEMTQPGMESFFFKRLRSLSKPLPAFMAPAHLCSVFLDILLSILVFYKDWLSLGCLKVSGPFFSSGLCTLYSL
jgi:hypothetical protein